MSDSVYKIIDLVGASTTSWEDAANKAIAKASGSLRDLRIAEVNKLDIKIEDGDTRLSVKKIRPVQLAFSH